MGRVFISMSMSLDGFITRPDITREHPFGVGGEQIYAWQFDRRTEDDASVVGKLMQRTGAVIGGGRTYQLAIDGAWGSVNPFSAPVFVLSHSIPDRIVDGFTFVLDGIESALTRAKAAAGEKDVWIMGGANVAQQYLRAGLVDELNIHLAPVLLGHGIRLFENIGDGRIGLRHAGLVQTPGATHIVYDKTL